MFIMIYMNVHKEKYEKIIQNDLINVIFEVDNISERTTLYFI